MMLGREAFDGIVTRAALAPSVHNVQPARWALRDGAILLGADRDVTLPVGDPTGQDVALSCGAALEATVLALSAEGFAAQVTEHWADEDHATLPGTRLVARLGLGRGAKDGLEAQLERRVTWRGRFGSEVALFGWDRADTVLIMDAKRREWLSDLNDEVSHEIMADRAFRRELLSWMRLRRGHRRYRFDGLNRDAMRMSALEGLAVPVALRLGWSLLRALGQTEALVSEGEATRTVPVIAAFHRPRDESPVASGRAYLRLCLEAASLGMAGWPMAALSDYRPSRDEIMDRLGIGPDRRLVQMVRFGPPLGTPAPRARRPLSELILDA